MSLIFFTFAVRKNIPMDIIGREEILDNIRSLDEWENTRSSQHPDTMTCP